jgi:hypothetical protein
MGVPASEVSYTLARTGRGDHKAHKGHVVALEGRKKTDTLIPNLNAEILHHVTLLR